MLKGFHEFPCLPYKYVNKPYKAHKDCTLVRNAQISAHDVPCLSAAWLKAGVQYCTLVVVLLSRSRTGLETRHSASEPNLAGMEEPGPATTLNNIAFLTRFRDRLVGRQQDDALNTVRGNRPHSTEGGRWVGYINLAKP